MKISKDIINIFEKELSNIEFGEASLSVKKRGAKHYYNISKSFTIYDDNIKTNTNSNNMEGKNEKK